MSMNDLNRYPYADLPSGVSGWVLGGVVGLCIVVVVGLIAWDGLNPSQIVRASTVPIHVEMTGFHTGAVLKPHPVLPPGAKPAPATSVGR